MTERQKQVALSKIKDNPELYERWEEYDKMTREIMLYVVLFTDEQLDELRRYMIKVMNI